MKHGISILASGKGSNFMAIYEHTKKSDSSFRICSVFSDNKEAPVLLEAKKLGLHSEWINPSESQFQNNLAYNIKKSGAAWVVLAGFMRILKKDFLKEFKDQKSGIDYYRVINIHPSLLPSFPGKSGYQDALFKGVKKTGATVHLVDDGVDTGPICDQSVIGVLEQDTLESLTSRGLNNEHELYSKTIQWVVKQEFTLKKTQGGFVSVCKN